MDELRIIKYLDGEMTGQEKQAFEDEISMNPELAGEVRRYRQIQDLAEKLIGQGVDGGAEEDGGPDEDGGAEEDVRKFREDPGAFGEPPERMKQELRRAEKDYLESRSEDDPGREGSRIQEPDRDYGRDHGPDGVKEVPVMTLRRIWYRAAAVVILALAVSILLFKPFRKMTSDEVYARYFVPFEQTAGVMEMARNDNDFYFAVEVYEAGDYERAAVLFENLAQDSVAMDWPKFYAASSYLFMNRSGPAVEILVSLTKEGGEEVRPHASWQLALAYISRGEPELARPYLESLTGDAQYKNQSRKIIRILY
jgi:hypothetical protein